MRSEPLVCEAMRKCWEAAAECAVRGDVEHALALGAAAAALAWVLEHPRGKPFGELIEKFQPGEQAR